MKNALNFWREIVRGNMKKNISFIAMVMIILFSTACSSNVSNNAAGGSSAEVIQMDSTNSPGYKKITPEEAKKRLESETEIILLDVRTQEEHIEKRIPDSMLIPLDVIEQEAPAKLEDKNTTIFVYCRSGRRSAIAAELLANMGYTNVYDLGGINDWTYETITG